MSSRETSDAFLLFLLFSFLQACGRSVLQSRKRVYHRKRGSVFTGGLLLISLSCPFLLYLGRAAFGGRDIARGVYVRDRTNRVLFSQEYECLGGCEYLAQSVDAIPVLRCAC